MFDVQLLLLILAIFLLWNEPFLWPMPRRYFSHPYLSGEILMCVPTGTMHPTLYDYRNKKNKKNIEQYACQLSLLHDSTPVVVFRYPQCRSLEKKIKHLQSSSAYKHFSEKDKLMVLVLL